MDVPENSFSEITGLLKSWIPRLSKPAIVSRDFWMPDHSCRVCYDCDSQFTIFNRRHHCRLCGRVFCAKCTSNSVSISLSTEPCVSSEEWEKIRVCNYCFKQWEGIITFSNGTVDPNLNLNNSSSVASLVSTKSSDTDNSSNITVDSVLYSVEPHQRAYYTSGISVYESSVMETSKNEQDVVENNHVVVDVEDRAPNHFGFCDNRSDDDEDGYTVYPSGSETQHYAQENDYYCHMEFYENDGYDESHKEHSDGREINTKNVTSSLLHNLFDSQNLEGAQQLGTDGEHDINNKKEDINAEPVDFENNGLLWLPPEPEDEEDEKESESILFDDDEGHYVGEWGHLGPSSSFGSGEYRNRDKSCEDHKNAMKNVVDGHFRALVSQLMQVDNLPVCEEDGNESWLELITDLSLEAATLLKPDMSNGGGMDPGGYVKVKCIASGRRSDSLVIKGVVCKKNVAHRRMTTRVDKPRLLILGGALEYQRVSNHLSSFDTLLQQEMDHLKMAVARIHVHQPDILLVEKSVSRFAQEYLLAKDISLVLNIKRPLLERIARCSGTQIVASIDHISSQKLGYCDTFHVERILEEHGSAQGGKKLVKTLMYFEGCPKPLGCTILLRGANVEELKKVKHALQYAIFAAYHLALETSFLADEGAFLSEVPLNSSINVALPDKSSIIERSVSMIPGFSVPVNIKSEGPRPLVEPQTSNSILTYLASTSLCVPNHPNYEHEDSTLTSINLTTPSDSYQSMACSIGEINNEILNSCEPESTVTNYSQDEMSDHLMINCFGPLKAMEQQDVADFVQNNVETVVENLLATTDGLSFQQSNKNIREEPGSSNEEFPPSPSDHQSILVSLSSRCVWKGTVCERSHLFRIKYYGTFDKPLGRFLRYYLFDQSYRCRSCEMPSEAHVHCYTHRQGTLTISVKKLPEFLLPGENYGKIWMWHRCLQCPRVNGFPPATRRIVMSDAAWGLSFGKFLELSFSNHAAASRVASCGHSLHRDCLRFYGFGKMVACFRYASIDVHSVCLPPSKLDFNYGNQEWIQKEASEVNHHVELLFSEVLNTLRQISEKEFVRPPTSERKVPDKKRLIAMFEGILQREKAEFEETLQRYLNGDVGKRQLGIDILEINRLKRQLVFQAYVWDHRLVFIDSADDMSHYDVLIKSNSEPEDKHIVTNKKCMEIEVGVRSCNSLPVDAELNKNSNLGNIHHSANGKEQSNLHIGTDIPDQTDSFQHSVAIPMVLSDEQLHIRNLSDTLDAKWIGDNQSDVEISKETSGKFLESSTADLTFDLESNADNHSALKGLNNIEDSVSWLGIPFSSLYCASNKIFFGSDQMIDALSKYNPIYVPTFHDLGLKSGIRLLLPVGINDTVIPVYDDEPTSIISYVLMSSQYHIQLSDEFEKPKDSEESVVSLPFSDTLNFQTLLSLGESAYESCRSLGSTEDSILSMSGLRSSLSSDSIPYTKFLHARVSFTDKGSIGKEKYTVICYYAKQFDALRRICCPSEINFVRSLSRCKKWRAQGGKSNAFFAKTLDDRFIVKQVTKTELDSFIQFAPGYFKYMFDSIGTGSPTSLAKILGIYQVASKHIKGGKESRLDVLVMENLLFGRNITRLYDLKGSSRSRYNADSSGTNKVLLDQNLIESMPTCPIFVGNKAKRLLERAVWNDTSFLASIDVMDYSLLVGVDEEKNELVLGIIDFMRQYTWDKHLETWVKASGILGGSKNKSPTVISPKQYKKRFRKAMTTYFLMVPDQWSPPIIIPSKSQSDLFDESAQDV